MCFLARGSSTRSRRPAGLESSISELGRRMGYGEKFPWKSDEEVVEMFLKESGIDAKAVWKSILRGLVVWRSML